MQTIRPMNLQSLDPEIIAYFSEPITKRSTTYKPGAYRERNRGFIIEEMRQTKTPDSRDCPVHSLLMRNQSNRLGPDTNLTLRAGN